jgi:predicted hotdog family 3-hydroxylacyl-ACP dehydratase
MSYLHPEHCPEILVLVGDETPPAALGLTPFASAVSAFVLTHPDRDEDGPMLEIVPRSAQGAASLPMIDVPSALSDHICGEATGLVAWLLDENSSGSATVRRRRPQSPWDLVAHVPSPARRDSMFPPMEELLPHRPPLLLLKEVVSFNDQHISCLVDATANIPFADAEGVDCVVTTEWMAQAVGAFVGAKKRSEGRAPQVGFIIGIRKVDFHAPKVKNAADVRVIAEPVWVDRASGSFNCSVIDMTNNNIIATGSLTVHEPGS